MTGRIDETADQGVHDADSRLAEVWGDVVDRRNVAFAVVLGIIISVPAFLGSQAILTAVMENTSLARTYAMLIGLGACLCVGVVCARLFPPVRIFREETIGTTEQEAAIAALRSAPNGLGSVDELKPDECAELEAMGLYDLFAEAEATQKREPADNGTEGEAER
ncbi:hypothetical protein [Gordonia humi]|uniref:Uncharacterized protein n=1 Tax=Gordonia humi TaxID=686429 RepID=A0A840F6V2_9ACTN|nr:hypothetical protein [Gordonia humi]MBB4138138.1 hypothetical protein [Gordonia humi]